MDTHTITPTPQTDQAKPDDAATLPTNAPQAHKTDEHPRHVPPRDGHQLSEEEIDQNSEDSFPASDPPSWSGAGL